MLAFPPFYQVTEELEGVKAEMDEKGTSMTDAGPLVRVKQALTRLKAECTQMDVRIGVVSTGSSLIPKPLPRFGLGTRLVNSKTLQAVGFRDGRAGV